MFTPPTLLSSRRKRRRRGRKRPSPLTLNFETVQDGHEANADDPRSSVPTISNNACHIVRTENTGHTNSVFEDNPVTEQRALYTSSHSTSNVNTSGVIPNVRNQTDDIAVSRLSKEADLESDVANAWLHYMGIDTSDEEDEQIEPHNVSSETDISIFFPSWTYLWAFVLSVGTNRLSREQHDSVRRLFNYLSPHSAVGYEHQLPSTKALQRLRSKHNKSSPFLPIVSKRLCSRGYIENQGPCTTDNDIGNELGSTAEIIYPSIHMKADLLDPTFVEYCISTSAAADNEELLHNLNLPHVPPRPCIDSRPIIRAREIFYGPTASISTDSMLFNGTSTQAEPGDTIQICFATPKQLTRNIDMNLKCCCQNDIPNEHSNRMVQPAIRGKILCVLDIKHKAMENMSERWRPCNNYNPAEFHVEQIINELEFVQGDGVKDGDSRPVLIPSDTIAVVSIHRNETGADTTHVLQNTVLIIVFRFFKNLHLPARFSFLYCPKENTTRNQLHGNISSVLEDPRSNTTAIAHITILEMHNQARGCEAHNPTSSIGRLSNGESYFIYRAILYWDSFQPYNGRNQSCSGIYLACVNTATENLRLEDVRTISVSPHSVSYNSILNELIEDICTASTDGVRCRDAFGNETRAFLDIIGVIADTPALNEALDTKGHNANSFCHLCNYNKGQASTQNARYCNTNLHSSRTENMRTNSRMESLRHSTLTNTEMIDLGIQRDISVSDLFLFKLSERLHITRMRVRNGEPFYPVVPAIIDPYRASLIAVDHMLAGLAVNFITAVYKCLPNDEVRAVVQSDLIQKLNEIKAPKQRKLFNDDSKQLLSMPISHVFSVLAVTPVIYSRITIDSLECNAVLRSVLLCLFTFTTIVGHMQHQKWATLDIPTLHKCTNSIQSLVSKLLNEVRKVTLTVGNADNPTRGRTANRRRRNTATNNSNNRRNTEDPGEMLNRLLDKPNMHRLVETVNNNLFMCQGISFFAELPFEHNHHHIKRALQQSNRRNAHVQAMEHARLNDWKKRLWNNLERYMKSNTTTNHTSCAKPA